MTFSRRCLVSLLGATLPGCSTTRATDPPCVHTTRGSHEYWMCTPPLTVAEARKSCESMGTDLAVVETAGENSFIASAISRRSVIGLAETSLPPPSDVWKWNSNPLLGWCGGKDGAAPSGAYANWLRGEPNVEQASPSERTRTPACTAIERGSGGWRTVPCDTPSAYVCETKASVGGPAFLAETTRVERARPGFAVQSLEIAPGVDPGNPFLRYAGAFGLRDCIDTLRPPITYRAGHIKPDEELGEYAQLYNGIPVEGGGFVVSRAKSTGAIRSISGGLIHGFTQTTTPAVTEADARETAQVAAGVLLPAPHPPTGTLLLARIRPRDIPSAFELAWNFEFAPGSAPALVVVVSAVTGQALRVVPRLQSDTATR